MLIFFFLHIKIEDKNIKQEIRKRVAKTPLNKIRPQKDIVNGPNTGTLFFLIF